MHPVTGGKVGEPCALLMCAHARLTQHDHGMELVEEAEQQCSQAHWPVVADDLVDAAAGKPPVVGTM